MWYYEKLDRLYSLLRELESGEWDAGGKQLQFITEIKKEIRRRRDQKDTSVEVVRVYPDGAMYKYPLGRFANRKEAEEWFMDMEFISMRYEPRDCTGRRFTGYHHVFQKPDGEWWCYHRIDIDC